jgi:hypothetical protein
MWHRPTALPGGIFLSKGFIMSVISTKSPHPRLPDQISIDFEPREAFARFFLAADRAVRDRGIYLSISTDLDELMEANRSNMKVWYPLMPMFDPAYRSATPENMFWIRGVNAAGEIVLTQAARSYLWPDTTLDAELEAMNVFYAEPAEQAAVGEHCIVGTEAFRQISGAVCLTGSLWFRPDYRGLGLARVMPRITRAVALCRFYPQYFFSILQQHIIKAGMPQVYGWPRVDAPFYWRGSPRFGDWDLAVGWMDTAEAVDDVVAFNSALAVTETLTANAA